MGKLQKQICQCVLAHFDKSYGKELGEAWVTVREVLTSPQYWQYAVLLNRFSSPSGLEKHLLLKGYQRLFEHKLSSLKCYISGTAGRFPTQRHEFGKLKDYYLLNAASLLPVLALDAKDGEYILDMCAAPGGKSIAVLQCASLGHLYCNEQDRVRSRWLQQTLESFIPDHLMNSVTAWELDGRQVGQLWPGMFDKVLVDAPCSNDRSWLFSSSIQQATLRIAQRSELPSLQIQLLRSAIETLRPGGSLVYSTCTLSGAENDNVVMRILDSCSNVQAEDLSDIAAAISQDFTLASGVEHGLLVLPDKGKAWGPMYVAKLKKI
ncbi:tRNA (cytosine(34)-C(5))-methyltransferase, mitochondrial [Microcaecilia unicolor]|uniref:5-cytosine rRNA methyltransferase NSUN4 n=1 Tax=Microcaecilia unicolor TaxID=1415580 RepID=A0A6P7Y7N5_9AMPH|nr:tRNA (cytosine(34)-C(5))-methyltransferase, mitochondrial [Microcaecilia unicolor]XP_030060986.1 tRNA (cytosine(34)-C(5))-methyltransferase, mitochondrial [Microcaecilia unicolor]